MTMSMIVLIPDEETETLYECSMCGHCGVTKRFYNFCELQHCRVCDFSWIKGYTLPVNWIETSIEGR